MCPAGRGKTHFAPVDATDIEISDEPTSCAVCSKRPSSKAAASEEVRRTLRYVEPLSETRTPLVDFYSILLDNLADLVLDHRLDDFHPILLPACHGFGELPCLVGADFPG